MDGAAGTCDNEDASNNNKLNSSSSLAGKTVKFSLTYTPADEGDGSVTIKAETVN